MTDAKNLTQLGKHVETPQSPEQAVLETVPFQRGDGPPAIVRFTCPEFTSLCPVTGQPDFAHIVIDYAPDRTLVESKSLKLFMTSFRNHGAFHEECTVMIGRRIVAHAHSGDANSLDRFLLGGLAADANGIRLELYRRDF